MGIVNSQRFVHIHACLCQLKIWLTANILIFFIQIKMHQHIENQDYNTYEYILEKQKIELSQIKPINAATAFLTHVLFKAITMMLFYFQQIFNELLTELVTSQLTIIFVVIDFWFTKNVNGRRLIGIRWFFGEDDHGVERFKFETRINDEYLSPVNSKLFWIIQVAFLIIPIVDLGTTIVIAPNLYRVNFGKVFVNLCVIAGGISNLFLFYKASAAASEKKMDFRRKYGGQFMRKLGANSLISYL